MESTPAALISWSLFDSTRGLSQHVTHRHLHRSSSCRPTLVPRSVHIQSFLIFNIFQAVLCLLQCIAYYPVSICVNLSFSTECGLTPMVQHLLSVGVSSGSLISVSLCFVPGHCSPWKTTKQVTQIGSQTDQNRTSAAFTHPQNNPASHWLLALRADWTGLFLGLAVIAGFY